VALLVSFRVLIFGVLRPRDRRNGIDNTLESTPNTGVPMMADGTAETLFRVGGNMYYVRLINAAGTTCDRKVLARNESQACAIASRDKTSETGETWYAVCAL